MSRAKTGSEEGLPRIIQEQLDHLLSPISVISVMVDEDQDYFDESAMHVVVVFDPNDGTPEVSGLVRQLRPVLASHGEERFPVFSFLTPEDAEDYRSRLT